ncbi:NADPH-dependent FMN reductase [Chondromyces crocatus]|uniref:FMN reductase n=1 Tax=Chondromyces crocatus TaxID=52 RepID=A0A0K1ENH2_CHOCO|nr:NAD(P)H-dependent oxidoreductase [Chondromyces crocatus]AKT42485.1 FMN reductase [Chondromyces crocatus]
MSDLPLHLAVLICATREGRLGATVARWFLDEAERRGDVRLDVIDLIEAGLPVEHQKKAPPEVAAFAAKIGAADAFVVVTSEYNHGYPALLKAAIDSASTEWHAKPLGFVSYGGTAGGLRAVEQLRQVFAELHVVTMRDTVSFQMAQRQFDEAGRPRDPGASSKAAKAMLDQLVWWGLALRQAREIHPYGRPVG